LKTKLVQFADGWALVINQDILDQLQFDFDTELEMVVQGKQLVIFPALAQKLDSSFLQAMKLVHDRYTPAFKQLAG
jgi:antitoxin component of MazEF toxin-antitoxin module